MSEPDVSIIVPVSTDVAGLEVTLDSLRAQSLDGKEFEVIVCNDGGGSRVSEVVRRYGFREEVMYVNSGSYAARNLGVVSARAAMLAFIDADQRADARWLAEGIEHLERHDYVAGRIVMDDVGYSQFDRWQKLDFYTAFPVRRYLEKYRFGPTANLFVRRSVFESVGPFDSSLRSGGDVEFGRRVFKAGLAQAYSCSAITVHPVRDARAQLRKMKRTAYGKADLYMKFQGRPEVGMIIKASLSILVNMAVLPFLFGLACIRSISGQEYYSDLLRIKKIYFNFYFIKRVLS